MPTFGIYFDQSFAKYGRSCPMTGRYFDPWVTEDFIIAIRERDFLCKKAKKTKSILDWEDFKQKRNHVNRLKNRLKNEYYNEVL